MAEANRSTTNGSFYTKSTAAENVVHALEMALEISDDKSRDCELAMTIEDRLRNREDAIGERLLSEVLSERIADSGQNNRLVECLRVLAVQLGVENAEKDFTDGAIAMCDAMHKLPAIVSSASQQLEAAEYFAKREAGIAALAEAIGPLSPHAAGAFAAIAEFVAGGEQDACTYNLEAWRPVAAMSKEERAKAREAVFALDCQSIN